MKKTRILEKVDHRRLLDESSIVIKTNDTKKSRDSKKTKSTKDTKGIKSIKNLNGLKETYKKIIFKYLVENTYRNQDFKK
ncbi:hypothetical protein DXC21_05900 [Coprobacillus sp. OM08-19]|jgi:hypothetical protein|uniref:hypothetical protein n=1 Tax=Faecalibacillus intestinalis TaxID=1982626 RepID=UPI000E4EE3DB|nr:hypothetical protein [Faecalibacillus intestinalis]RGH54544.1 hypothetical protein DW863_03145 [Coprobacillus sp. AM37-9BH]RGI25231.1 hypothetical protein DXC21_05900 [Coprobacillus sp. OM08-19]